MYKACTALDYADDITILNSGKYEGTVSEMMRRALNFVEILYEKECLSKPNKGTSRTSH